MVTAHKGAMSDVTIIDSVSCRERRLVVQDQSSLAAVLDMSKTRESTWVIPTSQVDARTRNDTLIIGSNTGQKRRVWVGVMTCLSDTVTMFLSWNSSSAHVIEY